MRRRVLLLLVLALLLCAQGIIVVATQASTRRQPLRQAPGLPLKVASLKFYYKQDEEARFVDLKTEWQTEHKGQFSSQKAVELADKAYNQAGVEAELSHWRAQGGPAPKTLTAKLHLYNPGKKAILNIPVVVTLKAHVGDLRVSPSTQLTDYAHLRQTAHWETVSSHTLQVPVVAPDEDQLLEVAQFRLLEFTEKHPNQWPESLQVIISAPQLGVAQSQLSLLPDHFVIPTLY